MLLLRQPLHVAGVAPAALTQGRDVVHLAVVAPRGLGVDSRGLGDRIRVQPDLPRLSCGQFAHLIALRLLLRVLRCRLPEVAERGTYSPERPPPRASASRGTPTRMESSRRSAGSLWGHEEAMLLLVMRGHDWRRKARKLFPEQCPVGRERSASQPELAGNLATPHGEVKTEDMESPGEPHPLGP